MSWPTRSLAVFAVSGALAAAGLHGVGRPGGPGVGPTAFAQSRDTLRAEDLRCLTRRPTDCLEDPVPRDEPHGAVCATCHNLWDQGVPADAVRPCTGAGCHSSSSLLEGFHGTVRPQALADCLHCHRAHAFQVPLDGTECTACHRGGGAPVEWVDAGSTRLTGPAVFTHEDHRRVACGRCHGLGDQHGTLEVATLAECRSCHHRTLAQSACVSCHPEERLAGVRFMVTRSVDIRVGSLDRPLRLLPFDHGHHATVPCTQCHTQGGSLRAAAGADCSACHLRHHEPDSDCSLCHAPPAPGAHAASAHLGCGGAGCHDRAPEGIRDAPRTRSVCLSCHVDRADHKPGRTCPDCHRLPPPDAGRENRRTGNPGPSSTYFVASR